ncbi:MAG: chromate transporter, partial [Gammaproteobacteria bacterium]
MLATISVLVGGPVLNDTFAVQVQAKLGWAALAGILTVPLLLVLCLAVLHSHYANHPGVAGALRGMAAVAAGLIAATGIKLAAALRNHPLPGWFSGAAAVLCVAMLVVFK